MNEQPTPTNPPNPPTALDWMMAQAGNGVFAIVMPDIRDKIGRPVLFSLGYQEWMWAMVDADPRVRACGFIGLALGAHERAEQHLASQQGWQG